MLHALCWPVVLPERRWQPVRTQQVHVDTIEQPAEHWVKRKWVSSFMVGAVREWTWRAARFA